MLEFINDMQIIKSNALHEKVKGYNINTIFITD